MRKTNDQGGAACPLAYLAEVFGGKWKLPIVCILSCQSPKRFSAIKRGLPGVTNVMLTQSLRELEAHGLIERRQYNEVPPHVEYSLTAKGAGTLPFITAAARWAADALKSVQREKRCSQCVENVRA